MRKIILLTSFLLVIGIPLAANAGQTLTNSQISQKLVNQPFLYRGHENGQKKEGRVVYGRGGKLFILTKQGYQDGGTWKLQNGRICTRVTLGRQGRETCFSVREETGDYYSTSHNYRLYPVRDNRFIGM